MKTKDFFPVSVWYGANRARAPMINPIQEKDLAKLRSDLQVIKKSGFNAVRFWYDWFTAEPKPGVWNFGEIDTLLSITDEIGLKALVQVYTDSAPNWVEPEYPDSLFVDRSGIPIHSQASPGYCSDHDAVREHIGEYLVKLAKIVSLHESFHAWDIWSEPHIVQWSWIDYINNPWFCFCENSLNRFKDWLKKKYVTIDKLNAAWYRTHRNWKEVIAPSYISLSTFTDVLDWIEFNTLKIAEDLKWKVEKIRSADPNHIISSHAAISSVYGIPGVGYGASDDWKLAEKVDVWGTSFYPKHTGPWMPLKPQHMGVALDATRSSCESRGKPFWIGELQTGDGVTGLRFGAPVTAKDLDRWAWLAVSRRAKGLNYYAWLPMSCGYEVSGFGLTEPDGSLNERVKSAGEVSRVVSENMEIFAKLEPLPAKVAVLYNVKSHSALACLRSSNSELIRKNMFGFYKVLMKKTLNVDFLHLEDLQDRDLSKYKLIYAPFSIMLPVESAQALAKYVETGGHLLADGRIGWMNLKGDLSLTIPGEGLSPAFGVIEDYTTQVNEETSISLREGGEIPASIFLSTYVLNGAHVLGTFKGKPVIVTNKFGKGRAIMAGTLLAHPVEDRDCPATAAFIESLLEAAGVREEVGVTVEGGGTVEVRLCESGNTLILFAFNHSAVECSVTVSLPRNKKYHGKATDLKVKTSKDFDSEGRTLKLDLSAEETGVYLID